jgi:hypothetical protein
LLYTLIYMFIGIPQNHDHTYLAVVGVTSSWQFDKGYMPFLKSRYTLPELIEHGADTFTI